MSRTEMAYIGDIKSEDYNALARDFLNITPVGVFEEENGDLYVSMGVSTETSDRAIGIYQIIPTLMEMSDDAFSDLVDSLRDILG